VIEHASCLASALVIWIDHLVQAVGCIGYEQREAAGSASGSLGDGIEQGLRDGCLVLDYEHSWLGGLTGGLHGWNSLPIAVL
jgi:hypothetical protein